MTSSSAWSDRQKLTADPGLDWVVLAAHPVEMQLSDPGSHDRHDQRWPVRGGREQRARRHDAELGEMARAYGTAINDFRQRAGQAIARSKEKVARSQAQIDRDRAARLRQEADLSRAALLVRHTHAGAQRQMREATLQTRAAVQHSRALRGLPPNIAPDQRRPGPA